VIHSAAGDEPPPYGLVPGADVIAAADHRHCGPDLRDERPPCGVVACADVIAAADQRHCGLDLRDERPPYGVVAGDAPSGATRCRVDDACAGAL